MKTNKEIVEMKVHKDFKNAFDSFERVEEITDVILLGDKGGIRRIMLE